jgi:hypothetical protein
MSFEMTLTEKPGYLHAVVTGQNTLDNVMMYLQELHQECEARGINRVLIEERLTGRRLETWDVYQIAADGSQKGAGKFEAVAYVDVNASGELMTFAETIANNRGIPMNLFSNVADAEAWLRKKIDR